MRPSHEGAETSNASTPFGWVKITVRVASRDKDFYASSAVFRDGRERGFKIGTALSKRDCQARLETAGPLLRPSVLILRDEHPHVCSQSLEGCRFFGTRGLLSARVRSFFLSSVRA